MAAANEQRTIPLSTEGKRLFGLEAQYIADLNPLPNLAYAAVVRSPHAHARVINIDADVAKYDFRGVTGA